MLWENINRILEEKNMSIYELTLKAGISKNALYELKSGRVKDLTFKTISKIADALEVSLDEFREE